MVDFVTTLRSAQIVPVIRYSDPEIALTTVKSLFSNLALMPTGGVSPDTAQTYLNAGALCVGMCGNLLPAQALEAGHIDLARAQINASLTAASFQSSQRKRILS